MLVHLFVGLVLSTAARLVTGSWFQATQNLLLSVVQLGVELPQPQQGRVLELAPTADGARAVASLQVWCARITNPTSVSITHCALGMMPAAWGLFCAELCAGIGVSTGVPLLQALDAGDNGPLQQMELDLLVGCGSLQPSAVVASCLAGAFIVWDGRLVVDAQFCSSNPNVMGAGPLAKFSRCVVVV